MAKKVIKLIKLQIPAGKANPAPPIGTVLGPAGINIGDFVSKFNAQTAQMGGDLLPVLLSVYEDRSYDFILKTPPVPNLIKKAIKLEKGAGKTGTQKVGKISKAQVKEIAETKMSDLNCTTVEAAMRQVEGSARSMGVEVVG